MADTISTSTGIEVQPQLDLILARAAAAFRDADFFESNILFWSAVLELPSLSEEKTSESAVTEDALAALASQLDLEEELGLNVQAEPPIDLVFPLTTTASKSHSTINAETISSIQTYIITALCYLSRHINVRIDILPTGQDTLTSLGPPQRYFLILSPRQKQVYHDILAIVLATVTSITITSRQEHPQEFQDQLQIQQSTLLGNSATLAVWQTALSYKKTPHNLPRFFSFLNPSSCTVAGCSILRNEQDVDALEQAGFRLIITLIKESPLSPAWFHHQTHGQQHEGKRAIAAAATIATPKSIRNAFVPIENRKAPLFPGVFEILMGWCLRAGYPDDQDTSQGQKGQHDNGEPFSSSIYPHQKATLIHCGGGKGRAGIVLAAYLIRFGLLGHEGRGYCAECLRNGNVHSYNLDQFRKGLDDRDTATSTLPVSCSSASQDPGSDDEEEEEEVHAIATLEGPLSRSVRKSECLNRFQPMMTAKDAMAHLRELRPGSIESVEQEKSVKAYGDWLWKRASFKPVRSRSTADVTDSSPRATSMTPEQPTVSHTTDRVKSKKELNKSTGHKSKPTISATSHEEEGDDYSDDDFERGGGRKSNKKGKKNSRKMPQDPPKVFVSPPADKIIKIPGSQHHQHHLVVQHNMRARQLQRGQKAKKNSGGGGKHSKERPSFQISGSPLESAPKLVILAGLPGSGKSHVVTTLLQELPEHFVRISQDELGSRAVCERLLAQSMRHQQQSLAVRGPKKALPMTIFVDRCNPTIAERKEWYEVAFQPDDTAMIWFSRGVEQCIERVDSRESHPTVAAGMGSKVVRSFAKGFEFPNLSKEGSWCQTLVEIGDDEGSDRLLDMMRKFAKDVPTSSSNRTSMTGAEAKPVKARPAFIPARALQRKNNSSATANTSALASDSASSGSVFESVTSHSKLPSSGNMESVEEEDEEEDDEDDYEDSEEDDDDESLIDTDEEESSAEDDVGLVQVHVKETKTLSAAVNPRLSSPPNLSITKALQFASLTGHRPAVKKPIKGSWKSTNTGINTGVSSMDSSSMTLLQELASPKGVSFATPLINYDRPLQKFPRTPHLFDPLTIQQSLQHGTDCISDVTATAVIGRSAAISRSDLLLPPSALHHVFAPKPHQVLTVEEKMDGANIGFSVLHFKTMNGFASLSGSGPAPKIRVQNRNHFVQPDDHWQFKKLSSWLDKHREDILYLCEGRWRFEAHQRGGNAGSDTNGEDTEADGEAETDIVGDDGDDAWADEGDEDEDENEYVDEDKVLQDGLAPYVLYGEWLYAKHSVQYTGLRSWFVPFDLYDVKTGTFVSRKLFQAAVAKTQLTPNPVIQIPESIHGDMEKMLQWTLQTLQSRSALMRKQSEDQGQETQEGSESADRKQQDRVEGLYFRVDQNDRLLMRSKVVRTDFIAGEERWGAKEQLANQLVPYEETLPDYDDE
ncbi:hypothetical protein EDD11_003749 [Mortierella claussenii]|nr:hypothetical protein EDD11_003749 [Mortierella claussenii]